MVERLAVIGVARALGDLTLGVHAGVVIDGHVDVAHRRHTLATGGLAALSLDWRMLARTAPLALTLGAQLGASHTTTRADDDAERSGWTALDVRVALTASRTFFEALTPYASARTFGGPILWRGALGTDTLHLQLALGLRWQVTPALSLHVEGAALSERGVFGGLGLAL